MAIASGLRRRLGRRQVGPEGAAPPLVAGGFPDSHQASVDLRRRRELLQARVIDLQFDLGGLAYEMAIRNRIRIDLLLERAAVLQSADAELAEVDRILSLHESGTAGACASCGAPHSSGATYCWQCGRRLLSEVRLDSERRAPVVGDEPTVEAG